MRERSLSVMVTCEHASRAVPAALRGRIPESVLNSHCAIDFGALQFAKQLARKIRAPLFQGKITRLAVDLNRSSGHKTLFSAHAAGLTPVEKKQLIQKYYRPYLEAVQREIKKQMRRGHCVLHFSIHSFTPRLNGKTRRTDAGILFDPARRRELEFARRLRGTMPGRWRVFFNQPYRGTADGLTTSLRRQFAAAHYLGLEIELNQKYPLRQAAAWRELRQDLLDSLTALKRG